MSWQHIAAGVMLWPILSTILFAVTTRWAIFEADNEREPQVYFAFFSMLIAALACGEAWQTMGA